MKIKINKTNLIPNKEIVIEAVKIGIITTLILFLISFFGLMGLFKFIPEGFRVAVLVIVSVYLSHLVEIEL